MIKKIKTWLIRLLGGFTESEMKNVLNALDKIILEKVRYIQSGRIAKITSVDVVTLDCKVKVKSMWVTPWRDRSVMLEILKQQFKRELLDELWKYADTSVEFSDGEQMARAEARIYVLASGKSTEEVTAGECIERT